MGKNKGQRYIVLSGLLLDDNNRGTAALGYGAFSFLEKHHSFQAQHLLQIHCQRNPFKVLKHEISRDKIVVQNRDIIIEKLLVWWPLYQCFKHFGWLLPFTRLRRYWKNVDYVAAINGGDGFSDIYGTTIFLSRLMETWYAMRTGKPLILLPQTIGPFKEKSNYEEAKRILKYASRVYVRDDKYVDELAEMGVKFELTNDLSAFMQPQPFDIDIKPGAIGLNISGLAYSNNFHTLSRQFENYPLLCKKIVEYFQKQGKDIYLISHSYNYNNPEPNNDDLEASRDLYDKLENKDGVHLIDLNLISPKTKYLISRMSFFIGTRMHANFAAIFTKVPVFGLAYSFKFQGAFENNGLYDQTAMINNISEIGIEEIIKKIELTWNKYYGC